MTAFGCYSGINVVAEKADEILAIFPPDAIVFPSRQAFRDVEGSVKDYLSVQMSPQDLDQLAKMGNNKDTLWQHLVSNGITLDEAKERLAKLAADVKQSKATSKPRAIRSTAMSDEVEKDTQTEKSKISARSISMSAKITVLAEKNPRREGSKTFEKFALYETGMTVAEFVGKGGRLIDVKADLERGHIAVSSEEVAA